MKYRTNKRTHDCISEMGIEEQGRKAVVEVGDPGIYIPDGVEYIASVRVG